jgi:hypothetical protein
VRVLAYFQPSEWNKKKTSGVLEDSFYPRMVADATLLMMGMSRAVVFMGGALWMISLGGKKKRERRRERERERERQTQTRFAEVRHITEFINGDLLQLKYLPTLEAHEGFAPLRGDQNSKEQN